MFDHLTSGIFEKPSLDKFRLIISLALFKSFSVIKNFIFFFFFSQKLVFNKVLLNLDNDKLAETEMSRNKSPDK